MKWFWGFVCLIVIGAGVLLFSGGRGSATIAAAPQSLEAQTPRTLAPAEFTRTVPVTASPKATMPATSSEPADAEAVKPATPTATAATSTPRATPPAPSAPPASGPDPASVAVPNPAQATPKASAEPKDQASSKPAEAITPVLEKPAVPADAGATATRASSVKAADQAASDKLAADALAALSPEGSASPTDASSVVSTNTTTTTTAKEAASATPAPAKADSDSVAIPDNPRFTGDKVLPAKATRRPDGALLLDGRFAVLGKGTAEDPYRVPWDLLVSAQESYKPRMGQTRMPQRVTMLDGAYVRISGYVAFPITSANPKEMLSMLNQWDGCCIGVPPTAYDAIEVRLANAANARQKAAFHGTVTGKLKVDPYVDGGWLLGMYVMDDAKLTVDD